MAKMNKGKRVRKRRPPRKRPPAEGMALAELAAQARVTPRAVRYYLERGALPPPEFRSSRTRYGREHVLRLRAILAMQNEGLDLDAIRRRLATTASADLEAYSPPSRAPAPAAAPGVLATSLPTDASGRWDHVSLLPGIELHVRADASPAVRRVAQEIIDQWVVAGALEPRDRG